MSGLSFVHRYLPSADADSPVLLLLHGTGGTESDLIPLGQALLPEAAILSLRGRVLENGMPRFFRRLTEGVFDLDDLKFQTHELAAFLDAVRREYSLKKNKFIAVGYSNGANIASSLLLLHPHHLSAAVLFRAMVPFSPDFLPDLSHASLFLGAGRRDPIIPAANTQALADVFEASGAKVSLHWHAGGHELAQDDLEAAQEWLVAYNAASRFQKG